MHALSRFLVIVVLITLTGPALGQEAAEMVRPPETRPAPAAPAPPEATKPEPAEVESAKPAGAPKLPDRGKDRVSISFENADINGVVKFLSTASGVPMVCDPSLSGNVTIISLKEIPLSDAFEVVNAALRVRGYAMIGDLSSKVIRVETLKRAVTDKVEVRVGKEPDRATPGDNMVTQVMPLDFASATKLRDELKPLVSDDRASIVAIASTNTLIVTDNAGNVHRIAEIVTELDKDTSAVIEVKVYKCKFSSAESLARTLIQIFPPAKAPTAPGEDRGRGGTPEGEGKPTVKTEEGLISLKGEIRITADARTNSLIISASKERVKLVESIVLELDVDTEPEVKVKVFLLKYADAKIVAEQLNRVFEQPQGGVTEAVPRYWYYGAERPTAPTGYAGLKRNVVVADMRTNSVIVTATEQNMRAFEDMINKLDTADVLSQVMRHFPLKYAKAADLAQTLNALFRGEIRRPTSWVDYIFGYDRRTEEGGPIAQLKDITVVPEEKTNALLVTGPPNAFPLVEKLIAELDKRTAQVFIEVAVVDVTLDKETRFGIEWTWKSAGEASDRTQIEEHGSTEFGLERETTGLRYSVITDNLEALVHALETRSNVKVLFTPTLTTADNVEGSISMGRDEPYVSSETETEGGHFRRTVDFKRIAVALTATPHVNGLSDTVALDLHLTVNEIIGRETELNAPIIAAREAQTCISVKDGETIVIGGIIRDNRQRITRGVPLLSHIPLVGELFKSRQWVNQRSELMVFITPHILADDEAVSKITGETIDRLSTKPKIWKPSGSISEE
ncbi:MAG TPA: secretin N-terminal domain-containing protein [Armatimonadota bacterium]|nr:secretin N-terminal domain-containing protein [Armatimonadota bacterium]